jgi:hypothetical protein
VQVNFLKQGGPTVVRDGSEAGNILRTVSVLISIYNMCVKISLSLEKKHALRVSEGSYPGGGLRTERKMVRRGRKELHNKNFL